MRKNINKNKNRDHTLDLLRGIAVLLMIITHVNGIFYSGDSIILNSFTWWGATVCFTMFLFVSASVTGIKFQLGKMNRRNAGVRLVKFLLVYYLVSFILVGLRFGFEDATSQILLILTFSYVPEFIEFILAFILFGAMTLLIPVKCRESFTKAEFLIPLTLVVFILFQTIYPIQTSSDIIITLKFLLTGHRDLHAFGILAYFPVYALGLWWGGNIVRSKGKYLESAKKAFILSFGFWMILIITGFIEGERWPPSITFLLYGVWFSFGIILLADRLMKVKSFSKSVIFIGMNAFDYYILHILLLYFMAYMTGWVHYNGVVTIFLLVFTLLLSTITVYIKKSFDIAFYKPTAH